MKFIDKIRAKLKQVLTLDRPPKIIALSSALGMLIGISPYVGTHTYLALLFSGWFNLPIYPLMIGAYVTNPITIPFIFGFTTKIGLIIMGRNSTFSFDWGHVTVHSLLQAGKTLILPFIIGTHVVGIILSILTYFIVYFLLKKYRKNGPKADEGLKEG